tara:strand:- start:2253 stop:3689 length:1437 start_codon:yes stop_codon:yes gene_type:complete
MPLIDLANPAGSQALAQLAGPFGSYLGSGSFPQSYEFAKKFVANPTTAYGSGSNGVTSLDDPTYLGFSLMFDISSPLFNGAVVANTGITPPEQNPKPTANGDVAVSGLGGTSSTPPSGAGSYPSTPSAVAYLAKIGETNRVEYLKAFIQGIQEINKTRPYYFQTIQGLLEAWQKSTTFSTDPYTGTTGEEGITIGCLEAIDLKLTALFSLYKMAVYDTRYKRFIVPQNLLRFDVYVYVQEIRKFKTVRNWLGALNPSKDSDDTKKLVNENTSQVGFKFTECMWDPGASGNVFEGVTNNGGDIATTQIKWNYGLMENVSQFSGYNSKLDASKIPSNTDPSFKDKLKQFGKDQLANAAEGAINAVGRTVSSAIQGLTLGNVFGLRNELLGAISNPQGLINAAVGAAIQGGELPTFGNESAVRNIGDSPLGAPNPPNNTLSGSDQVFDPSANTLGGLTSLNAFGPSGPPPNSTITDENIFD